MLRYFERNTVGRDLIVGDIHGSYSKLGAALNAIDFDPGRDRLFCVGDLVDRGPESAECLDWLAQPWFFSIEGNHEQLARDYAAGLLPAGYYAANGGAWFIALSPEERTPYVDAFTALATAITLDTEAGPVGLVHANCGRSSWAELISALDAEPPLPTDRPGQVFVASPRNACVWDRSRIESGNATPVAGVRAVICGHTIVEHPLVLGNVHFIDTGACRPNGRFTILDAATLQPATALACA